LSSIYIIYKHIYITTLYYKGLKSLDAIKPKSIRIFF